MLIVFPPGHPLTRAPRLDSTRAYHEAVAFHEAGRLWEAERLYHAVLKTDRDHFGTLLRLGLLRLQVGQFEEAVRFLRRATRQDRRSAEAVQLLASALTGLGRCEEAILCYHKALALKPDFPEAHNNLGHTLQTLGRFTDAIAAFEKAIALRADYAEAQNNLGNVLHVLDRSQEAVRHYEQAIAIWPTYAEAHWNLGNALRAINRAEDAIGHYEKAIAIRPDYAEAFNSLANAFRILGRHGEAIARYGMAIAVRPDYADAHLNLGRVLAEYDRQEEALVHYDNVLRIRPDDAEALSRRGQALASLKRHPEAVASFEQALSIDPDHAYALDGVINSAADACDWPTAKRRIAELVARVRRGASAEALNLLVWCGDPSLHLAGAETYVRNALPERPAKLWTGAIWRNRKIRLAYVAAGFHKHPTAYLTAELFEIHDRSCFEVIGVSLGPDDQSDIRARIIRGFDQFYDVRPQTDDEVARLIHDMQVDIVIDRSGHTANSRLGIFARRPAPIQVNYIGYPGTLGADFYDYVIADRAVLPLDQQKFYVEKIVHLPDSYLVNDSKRPIAAETPSREEVGLPAQGFVFCCFNKSTKITPQMFDIWMRLLSRIEGSALWLLRTHPDTETNLGREAAARGVDPARLVYADRVQLDLHLARHRLADLFLDTLPYNAHTTASDALWAGVPVVTCLGQAFAGRVAASLLYAIGLPELVTDSLEDYEACAFRLCDRSKVVARVPRAAC